MAHDRDERNGELNMSFVLGIDEAGRGPVIGPLVIAGVLVNEHQLKELITLGVRDSKTLAREKRTELAREIDARTHRVSVVSIPACELEANLTRIELEGMAKLIRDLRPAAVYLDAPVGPQAIPRFIEALGDLLGGEPRQIVAENKADARFPVVAAASIMAKVHRDREIEKLRSVYGDLGWGYPSEPKVRSFLREWYARHGSFPPCVRARWATVRRIHEEQREPSLEALVNNIERRWT
jgi:ribonuclease HII